MFLVRKLAISRGKWEMPRIAGGAINEKVMVNQPNAGSVPVARPRQRQNKPAGYSQTTERKNAKSTTTRV